MFMEEIIEMRKRGVPIAEIAEKTGRTKRSVYGVIYRAKIQTPRRYGKHCRSKALEAFMNENKITWAELGKRTGIPFCTLYGNFCGCRCKISDRVLNAVSSATGIKKHELRCNT